MRLPEAPPDIDEIWDDPHLPYRLMSRTPAVDHKGRYLHWDEVRNRQPPAGLSTDQWWAAMWESRLTTSRKLPLRTKGGDRLRFSNVDEVQRQVHLVDQQIGGRVGAAGTVPVGPTRRYVRALEEEAITSSQLEGAMTTRREAKRLLATDRQPRTVDERMIVNNLRGMQRVKELVGTPLTPDLVLALHRTLTEDTLDDPSDVGRLQAVDDDRIGVYAHDGTLVHEPPSASELPDRLDGLCRFANGATGDGFLHPVVRAIVVHFMLSYDHPFRDGNGRTARALFYWSLLDSGYELAEYVSISSLLKQAPARYSRAFQYTETDDGDVTYFVLHQLEILLRAIDALWKHVDDKVAETGQIEALVRGSDVLNHRQLALIRQALHDPNEPVAIADHQHQHGVTHETARQDLLGLEALDLFDKRKRGRAFAFVPRPGLEERLRALGDRA